MKISLKGQLIKTRCVILRDNSFISKYSFHVQNPQYTCFNWMYNVLHLLICYMGVKYVTIQQNLRSDFQYARFHILAV